MNPFNKVAILFFIGFFLVFPLRSALAQTPLFFPLDLPLHFDGQIIGMVSAEVSIDGQARIEIDDFASLLQDHYEGADKQILGLSGFYPVKDVSALFAGQLRYLPQDLILQLSLPVEARAVTDLPINMSFRPQNVAPPIAPAMLSAGIDFDFNQRFTSQTGRSGTQRAPLAGAAEGFVRFGKGDPFYLSYELDYLAGEGGWKRVQTTAFYDDRETAIRYSIGDMTPRSIGYQSSLVMGGISAERLYSEIQPFRRILPSGRSQLTLEKTAQVDVIINDVQMRSFRLDPGQYNVKDFPLVDGLNEVTLRIRDEAGREETLNYDFYSDGRLLDPGLSRFSFSTGKLREREDREVSYRGEGVISSWYERGMTKQLTLAGYGQGAKDDILVGAQASYVTGLGLFYADIALKGQSLSKDYAAELGYNYSHSSTDALSFIRNHELDLTFETSGDDYAGFLGQSVFFNQDYTFSARYRARLRSDYGLSLGFEHQDLRRGQPSEQVFSLSLTRLFGRVSASLTADVERADSQFENGELLVSLSMPLGQRDSLRFTAETEQNRVIAEWNHFIKDGINTVGSRVQTSRTQDRRGVDMDLDYRSNRFDLGLRHDYDKRVSGRDEITRDTELSASFGLGYADGAFGIGRSVTPGFILAQRHYSIDHLQAQIKRTGVDSVQASTDIAGPAMVPVQRRYIGERYTVFVRDLPMGYNIGDPQIAIQPAAFGGYRTQIGQAASLSVMGYLRAQDGAPVPLVTGKIYAQNRGDTDEPLAIFFTNRTGRLVADGLKPGDYLLFIDGLESQSFAISIPEGVIGYYDIGTLSLTGGQE